DKGVITKIDPRRNYIIRKSTKLSKEAHIIASNVDQAFLIVSLRDPVTMSMFIDRFLISAEAYKIPARLIFNKTDLYREKENLTLREWKRIYEAAGYPCYESSVPENTGIDELRSLLLNKITVFSGNSGVGKSSLINCLKPDLNLKIQEISEMHKTGKHTTTYAEMFEFESSGWIIDTPGIRGFGTVDMQKEELYHFFPEIFEKADNCRYHNCTHSHEPDCAVVSAVEEGKISFMRYNNYISLLTDNDEKYRKTPW
ncbi:MAG: ribosome small subunit-dependent GTPase A, partial [Bacteroidetes bacterium]|nr:ribosome small subunit-dependent GTPase A [Bacteroidota bacterium]